MFLDIVLVLVFFGFFLSLLAWLQLNIYLSSAAVIIVTLLFPFVLFGLHRRKKRHNKAKDFEADRRLNQAIAQSQAAHIAQANKQT